MLFPKDFGKVQLMLLLLPFTLRQALITSYSYAISKVPRYKRHLVFPPAGKNAPTKSQIIIGLGLPMEGDYNTVIGYVMKWNFNLPSNVSEFTEPYVRYARSNEALNHDTFKDNNTNEETWKLTRYYLYDMISKIDASALNKACLLKTICEAAEAPFRRRTGLLPELLHVLFTPSTTLEQSNDPTDREYLAAEILGRVGFPGQCTKWFSECKCSILEYFTEVLSH